MPKPITPYCGCDVFIADKENRILLIRRADNGYWAMPGGCQNLDETPAECAVRECKEETGLEVKVTALLGVWSSLRYPYIHYPWKENIFTNIAYRAEIIGGTAAPTEEASETEWFGKEELPRLSDGHEIRITFGFRSLESPGLRPYFE